MAHLLRAQSTYKDIRIPSLHHHTHTRTHTHRDACDLVPKGAQEKRTEVLENKVDRM